MKQILLALLTILTSGSNALNFEWRSLKSDTDRSARSYKIVCYYTNWAQYRPKPGSFFPENIDPKLCTHIIFAFAKLSETYELKEFEWNDESTPWSKGMYERVVQLKIVNPELKVLLAVGGEFWIYYKYFRDIFDTIFKFLGWNHGSLSFSNMASDTAKRANFVAKSVEFLKKNKFDGLGIICDKFCN